MTADWKKIIFELVCPIIGIFISTALYSAPVKSLAAALEKRSLGVLNPKPWGYMTGNCFGWLVYAYYSRDPFVLASNIPGILVSLWLNSGASKLQYYTEVENRIVSGDTTDNSTKSAIILTPQDKLLLGVLSTWISIIVCVGWFRIANGNEKEVIGILVNINLLIFYGAPLQTLKIVLQEKTSDSIHTPTMILNCTNAGFWGAYGIAINNPVIYWPNGIGLILGLSQATLCCVYPKNSLPQSTDIDITPLLDSSEDDSGTDTNGDDVNATLHQFV